MLPPEYRLRLDPDLPVLCRADGSEVAAFSSRGVSAEHIEAVAWEDAGVEGAQLLPERLHPPPWKSGS